MTRDTTSFETMDGHQSASCAYPSGLDFRITLPTRVEDPEEDGQLTTTPTTVMADTDLPDFDQTMSYEPYPLDQLEGIMHELPPQKQQQTPVTITKHNSQTDNLDQQHHRCLMDDNDEQGFWARFVDLDGQSTAADPGMFSPGAHADPLKAAPYHLTGVSGGDFLADRSSHVLDISTATSTGLSLSLNEDNIKEATTDPFEAQHPTTGLVLPDGEYAPIPGDVGTASRLLAASRLPYEPQTRTATRPDDVGLVAPFNDAFDVAPCAAEIRSGARRSGSLAAILVDSTAEPHTSRLHPYCYITTAGPCLSVPVGPATLPTPSAMSKTDDGRVCMSAVTENIVSYPSPSSESAAGFCSPPATTPSVSIAMGEQQALSPASASASASASVDGVRSTVAFRRDRHPRRNDAGEIHCDYPDCRDQKRTFRRLCEWNKHMDKHERPYGCQEPECNKLAGFTYSGGLLRHQREVHKMRSPRKRLMWCPIPDCSRSSGKPFTRQENLREHLRRVHRVTANDGHYDIAAAINPESHEALAKHGSTLSSSNNRSAASTTSTSTMSLILKRLRSADESRADNHRGGSNRGDSDDDDDVHGLRRKVKRLRRENQEKDACLDELETALKDLQQQSGAL